jgi:hypothetical protein
MSLLVIPIIFCQIDLCAIVRDAGDYHHLLLAIAFIATGHCINDVE